MLQLYKITNYKIIIGKGIQIILLVGVHWNPLHLAKSCPPGRQSILLRVNILPVQTIIVKYILDMLLLANIFSGQYIIGKYNLDNI